MAAPKRREKVARCPGVYRSISGKYEIAYRDSDGRLRFQTVGGTLEEAKAARAEKIAALGRGEKVRPSRVTFADFAEEVVSGLQRAPRTIEKHRYHLRAHLLPRFGRKRLAEIDTLAAARVVSDMERAGFAGWTIAGTLATLSLVMRKAKRQGLVPANPVSDLESDERPATGGGEKRVLDEAEIGRLLETGGETFRPLLALMIFSGVRVAEALGLTWADIDFDGGFIRVRAQLNRQRERIERAKTDAGRRDIVLMPQLASVLRAHKMASRYKAAGAFLFPAPDGRGRDHRSTSRGVERAVKRAGLGEGVSSHNCRHTFASLLIIGLGLDPVRVSKQLGHTDSGFTMRTYAHLFEKARHADELRAAMDTGLGHLLSGVNAVSTRRLNGPHSAAVVEAQEAAILQ